MNITINFDVQPSILINEGFTKEVVGCYDHWWLKCNSAVYRKFFIFIATSADLKASVWIGWEINLREALLIPSSVVDQNLLWLFIVEVTSKTSYTGLYIIESLIL